MIDFDAPAVGTETRQRQRTSRRGRLLTCSTVRFIRSEFGQVELGDGQILLDAVTEPGVTFELFSEARTIRLSNHCLMSVASVLMGW